MTKAKIGVTGGRLEATYLPSTLSEKDYAIRKIIYWHKMLKEMMIPKKWFKPTKKGTKITFVCPQNQAEMDKAVSDFKTALAEVNECYDAGLEVGPEEESA